MKLFPIFSAAGAIVLALASTGLSQTEAQDQAALEAARAASLAARGQYNYSAAAAAKEEEEARAAALDTSSRALREWYARKQLNADYLAAKNRTSPGLLYRLAEIKRPDRLTLEQYSRETGKLNWPAVLAEPIFDEERLALDRIFAQRGTFDAGTDSEFYRLTLQWSKKMNDKMVDAIDQLSTAESVSARKFLRSLEYEARILPGDLGGLVAVQQR